MTAESVLKHSGGINTSRGKEERGKEGRSVRGEKTPRQRDFHSSDRRLDLSCLLFTVGFSPVSSAVLRLTAHKRTDDGLTGVRLAAA